ncbi:MAG: DUF5054 domain-containing protein [Clostridia bacterium]|nr:DUF5054 domain-containing protein [Clostridia bacterium]
MKKVIVVSKTHLDLGFTDFAETIRRQYINAFIPAAARTAAKVNTARKQFVWTTGAWILKEALRDSSPENKALLLEALRRGDIAPHAMPFTTHTELLDPDTLQYGLSIVDEIDAITGRKTVAAKMTDVPGHTAALIPYLAARGVKLLHIGVNGASALPKVPACFLWQYGGSEIVVIYSGEYGGAYTFPATGDVLYFDHTVDNRGADSTDAVAASFAGICERYAGYEVTAGRLDDFAEIVWQHKNTLPVLRGEIGDTWIHGAAADPYKTAAARTLMRLKNKWLADGSLQRGSKEYTCLADNILCICEHTCGADMKKFFADFENYLRPDFEAARAADAVTVKHPEWGFYQDVIAEERAKGAYLQGSYQRIEASWAEQRAYITKALDKLTKAHNAEAQTALQALRPSALPEKTGARGETGKSYRYGDIKISVNAYGGIATLVIGSKTLIAENDKPALSYHAYGSADYDFWLTHYSRNIEETKHWSIADFARPYLEKIDDRYPHGRFPYTITALTVAQTDDALRLTAYLTINNICHTQLGAAKRAAIRYTVVRNTVAVELYLTDKPANRLTESTIFTLYPVDGAITYEKLGTLIDPLSVAENGGRNLSAVTAVHIGDLTIHNDDAPLVSMGKGKILEFDNRFEDIIKDGVSYILHNNVWGTNFPLWYEEAMYFRFTLT